MKQQWQSCLQSWQTVWNLIENWCSARNFSLLNWFLLPIHMLILTSRMVRTNHIHRPITDLIPHMLQIILTVPQRRRADILRTFPMTTTLILGVSFGEFGREQVEVVWAGLGMDGEEVGLGFAGVVKSDAGGHVDEENRCGG